jgi:hypothetical protein
LAQKVITEFIDDIDGSPAERTFTFAVDGTAYEIDLSSENIAEFKSAIGGFIESARTVKAPKGRRSRRGAPASAQRSRDQLATIREWARKNGYSVSDRGRISGEVMSAFEKAHAA